MLRRKLKELRISHNLTQKNLSDVLGIDRTTYTFYETGATQPSIPTICKIAEIYNVTVDYLVRKEEYLVENGYDSDFIPTRVSSKRPDTLAYLKKEEQYLLMYYRLISDENKKEIDELLKKFAEEDSQKEEIEE